MRYVKKHNSGIDILLIQPSDERKFFTTEGMRMPTGLGALAAYLESRNIFVEIFDMRIYHHPHKRLFKILDEKKPKMVGIPSYSPILHKTIEIAQLVKEFNPAIKVTVGGMHASAVPIETMQACDYFDYLVRGEGEITLYELLENLLNEKETFDIKGMAVRMGNQIRLNPPREFIKNIDALPFLSREKMEMHKYKRPPMSYFRLPTTEISTARGCSYCCTFCPTRTVWGSAIRLMSPERVINEVAYCIKEFNIRDFFFVDDVFTWPRTRIEDICNRFISSKLGITWSCYSRVDTVDYDLLQLMKKAGCYNIKYGVESGNERSLKLINKGTNLRQAEEAVRLTKMAGIECFASFMIGIFGEDAADAKETIDFAKKISPDLVDFRIAVSFPGTKLFEEVNHRNSSIPFLGLDLFNGVSIFDFNAALRKYKNLVTLSLRKKAYLSFYFSPHWLWQLLTNIFKNPKREIKKISYGIFVFLRLKFSNS